VPRLRVAVDATSLYDPRTGVGRVASELLAHVGGEPDLDVQAYAVTWRGHGDLASLLPDGVRATPGKMAAKPLRALWLRSDHPRIERWTGAVDVVHGPNFVVPPARATRVVTIHDLTFLHHPELCTADVLQYPGLLRRAIASGAWVHAVSEFVRQEVIDVFGAAPERVVAIPNGVTSPPSLDAAEGRRLAGADPYVLALGTVEPRKDLPTLVRAFDDLAARHPDLRLVVAGADGWGVDAYEAAVQACRHGDRVVRLGYVTEAQRGDLLAGAAVVAVPSLYEGFGLVAAEAMLAGTPVVASDRGSHPEVVGSAGLLVPASDPSALAAALEQVLTDHALADRLAAAGPSRSARYTWPAMAAGVVGLWRTAVAAQGDR
jgi:glycosyltransferase involved in cell wall biosynthesis